MIFGFNTDVKYDNTVYHVQSEARLHELILQTQVFVKGRCIGKHTTSYAERTQDPAFSEEHMHEMLKDQHKHFVAAIRDGRINSVLDRVEHVHLDAQTTPSNTLGTPADSTGSFDLAAEVARAISEGSVPPAPPQVIPPAEVAARAETLILAPVESPGSAAQEPAPAMAQDEVRIEAKVEPPTESATLPEPPVPSVPDAAPPTTAEAAPAPAEEVAAATAEFAIHPPVETAAPAETVRLETPALPVVQEHELTRAPEIPPVAEPASEPEATLAKEKAEPSETAAEAQPVADQSPEKPPEKPAEPVKTEKASEPEPPRIPTERIPTVALPADEPSRPPEAPAAQLQEPGLLLKPAGAVIGKGISIEMLPLSSAAEGRAIVIGVQVSDETGAAAGAQITCRITSGKGPARNLYATSSAEGVADIQLGLQGLDLSATALLIQASHRGKSVSRKYKLQPLS